MRKEECWQHLRTNLNDTNERNHFVYLNHDDECYKAVDASSYCKLAIEEKENLFSLSAFTSDWNSKFKASVFFTSSWKHEKGINFRYYFYPEIILAPWIPFVSLQANATRKILFKYFCHETA